MEHLSHSLVPTPQDTPEVLFPCLSRSEPNLIYDGCLHGLDLFRDVPRMLDGHFNTLGSLSCSMGHSLAVCRVAVSIVLLGQCWWGAAAMRVGTMSAVVFRWVVLVRWHQHELQDPRFSSRTFDCNEMINVIHSTGHCF